MGEFDWIFGKQEDSRLRGNDGLLEGMTGC
jgi:hypothetical protein